MLVILGRVWVVVGFCDDALFSRRVLSFIMVAGAPGCSELGGGSVGG